jgi:hypothetical protein
MSKLEQHYRHAIYVNRYLDMNDKPINYSLECEDCNEVIFDEFVAEW